jgi:arginine-tRNA-protein transferase
MEGVQSPSREDSIVDKCGQYRSHCGYCCDEGDTSVTYGMLAHRLTVDAYQDLLDCGWRRSGCWLYRPITDVTCCPPYTIRLDVHKFKPSKVRPRICLVCFLGIVYSIVPYRQDGE